MVYDFTKYEGCGNDFVFFNCMNKKDDEIDYIISKTTRICDRHFGIGADGVILILPSDTCDFKMRIINNDGSEAEMCGNGIRCFAKAVMDYSLNTKTTFTIETKAGTIIPEVMPDARIKVDMGEPILKGDMIPTTFIKDKVVKEEILVQDKKYNVTCVSMGNPHAVIFVDDHTDIDLVKEGSAIEVAPYFPKKTNVEFIKVVDDENLVMKVWERGTGITLACGTGACASLVASVLNGYVKNTAKVQLDGGTLEITWADDNHIYMTGPARKAFVGNIEL